jgi:hypothetical protein
MLSLKFQISQYKEENSAGCLLLICNMLPFTKQISTYQAEVQGVISFQVLVAGLVVVLVEVQVYQVVALVEA